MAYKTRTYNRNQQSFTDSSGNNVSNNRAEQINRTEDIKNVSVGLYDVDEAIYYYFENVIKPRVKEGEREKEREKREER